jgi:hypothetical protein
VTDRIVMLEISLLEAAHLGAMVGQFIDLIDATPVEASAPSDPAVARLVPDAYADDAEASTEFRRLTGSDLLDRRRRDADTVLASLAPDGVDLDLTDADDEDLVRSFVITLDRDEAGAWMRVLAAVRLVLASRLGIESEEDSDASDPRFDVYEWLGMRLEGLVQAVDAAR